MAHSIIRYTGTGTSGPFAVNFTLGFISREHVTAYVIGEVDAQGVQILREIDWLDDGLISVGSVNIGNELVISRDTPITAPIHDYQDTAVLNEQSLDESNLQSLMLVQEIQDGKRKFELYSDLNANGFRITNISAGVNGSDAVTLDQLDEVHSLALTTIDRVENASSAVVAASLEVDANLLVSIGALSETRDLANVVAASAATVEGLAEEVLVTASVQATNYAAAVNAVQLAGQAIKVESLQLVQDEIALAEARATDAAIVQAGSNTLALAACTEQRALAESNAISAAASAASAAADAVSFASIHDAAITQLEPMVSASVDAVVAATNAASAANQSSIAAGMSAGVAYDNAVHAEEQAVLASIEAGRASAYANATGNSLSITSSISDIVGDVIDLEYLVLQESAFSNENYPLLRMDLAAESGELDLGGLT